MQMLWRAALCLLRGNGYVVPWYLYYKSEATFALVSSANDSSQALEKGHIFPGVMAELFNQPTYLALTIHPLLIPTQLSV